MPRRTLALMLTSAIAACGTDGGTTLDASTADAAGQSDASGDASADATVAPDSAATDASSDACALGLKPDGDGGCYAPTVRRPFLIGASMRSSNVKRASSPWMIGALDGADLDFATRQWLARAWLKDALEEHASIAAFARFTMLLLSVGAPPELVAASQRASLDEIAHARACFALAARYGMAPSSPAPLEVHDSMSPRTLVDIVSLMSEEGCVGETLGAAIAEAQLAIVTDEVAVRAIRKIARDEARHAELAWKFLRWAVLAGGDPVREAANEAITRAARETLNAERRSYEGIDLAAWRAHGRLTCDESHEVVARAVKTVIDPCLAAALA